MQQNTITYRNTTHFSKKNTIAKLFLQQLLPVWFLKEYNQIHQYHIMTFLEMSFMWSKSLTCDDSVDRNNMYFFLRYSFFLFLKKSLFCYGNLTTCPRPRKNYVIKILHFGHKLIKLWYSMASLYNGSLSTDISDTLFLRLHSYR